MNLFFCLVILVYSFEFIKLKYIKYMKEKNLIVNYMLLKFIFIFIMVGIEWFDCMFDCVSFLYGLSERYEVLD